jgi:two-component system sensor histidine kinase TctE
MKIFQREQRSLFGEILDWMLIPVLLLWPVTLVLTWLVAQGIAGKPFDRALEYKVGALAKLVAMQKSASQFILPQAASAVLSADDTDTVYYQVAGDSGEVLSGEKDLPAPQDDERAPPGEMRLRETQWRGQDLKVAYMWVVLDLPSDPYVLIQVAETMEKRSVLAKEIVKGVMLPQLVILPLAVLLVWLALARAITPLNRLEERIRARNPEDLSPLDVDEVPMEVLPMVSSVNDLLMRLKDSIATQKRFLADAAHQLKTPLAGLRMQADLAQRQDATAQELKQSLRHIGRSSIRATHTVNQLLALARAESSATVREHRICNLAKITMDVVRDCVPRAVEKQIDIGYEGADPDTDGVVLMGNATLLQEMVRNLVDNAINYTPSRPGDKTMITVRVLIDPFSKDLVLQVEDTGPGIAAAERERVFQPFYRVLGNEADGSGLGLPIVLEIAKQHSASVCVEDSCPGQLPPGARFTVRFNAVGS